LPRGTERNKETPQLVDKMFEARELNLVLSEYGTEVVTTTP
jgi:hypothetical protein